MIEETGDLIGLEVTVIPQVQTAYVLLQCAEGVPSKAMMVPAHIGKALVEFNVLKESPVCAGKYSGTVTARERELKLQGATTLQFLSRQKVLGALTSAT